MEVIHQVLLVGADSGNPPWPPNVLFLREQCKFHPLKGVGRTRSRIGGICAKPTAVLCEEYIKEIRIGSPLTML